MDFIQQLIIDWGYWGLFILILLDNMNIPMPPTEVILSYAGWLVAKGTLSFPATFLVSLAGGVSGCLLFYVLIRYGSRSVVPKIVRWLRISDKKFNSAQEFFHQYGGIGVLLGRLIPGMRTISLIPAGLGCYPILKFIFYVTIGTAIWNGILLYLGYTASHTMHHF